MRFRDSLQDIDDYTKEKNTELREQRMRSLNSTTKNYQEKWKGHVNRMEETRPPKCF